MKSTVLTVMMQGYPNLTLKPGNPPMHFRTNYVRLISAGRARLGKC